jgi:peptidase E
VRAGRRNALTDDAHRAALAQDMPIVWPAGGLGGLGLVPFQLNTHYIDEEREVKAHMGESREWRCARPNRPRPPCVCRSSCRLSCP